MAIFLVLTLDFALQIFNQITLVCHWFWDVDCSKAQDFYEYSNSRLYQGHDVPLLDNEDSYVAPEAAAAAGGEAASAQAKPKKSKKTKPKAEQ